MSIHVTGKNFDLGSAFRKYVTDEISKHLNKYFDSNISASVNVDKSGHNFTVDIVVDLHIRHIGSINVCVSDVDIYRAADKAVKKIESKIRRYKDKIKSYRSKHKVTISKLHTKSYVVSHDISGDKDNQKMEIVEEGGVEMKEMSIDDAVMFLELKSLPFLLFVNEKTTDINFIYLREDLKIGWMAPYTKYV